MVIPETNYLIVLFRQFQNKNSPHRVLARGLFIWSKDNHCVKKNQFEEFSPSNTWYNSPALQENGEVA